MKRKLYLAYGSNLNQQQMLHRCPGAYVVGCAVIPDYELLFKGSLTGAYLTIEPKKGGKVPVAVWAVTEGNEASLDRYEGCPTFYYKKEILLPCIRQGAAELLNRKAFVYIMHEERLPGMPSGWYVEGCREGYRSFGFDERILMAAVLRTRRLCDEKA